MNTQRISSASYSSSSIFLIGLVYFLSQVAIGTRVLPNRLPTGATKIVKDPNGDATTTLYLDATSRSGKYPVGIITSSIDKFIDAGTTTEYMTQHVGTYVDGSRYAKVESTSTREYYRIPIEPTSVQPTGLIASTISYEVNGPGMTTEHTVHQYRTYVDGHYAHLVSSISNVYYDPPIVSATPVYNPLGDGFEDNSHGDDRRNPKQVSLFPREHIRPAKPLAEGLFTRSIGTRTFGAPKLSKALRLDDLIEAESKRKHLHKFKGLSFEDDDERFNLIRARSIKSDDFKPTSVEEEKVLVPTLTVNEDGLLHIPTPSIEVPIHENEIEPTNVPHRFGKPVKPSRTSLDSVTYVGFVDFTTTIDDTVVIFRPKKTFRTATRNILIPKIIPSRSSFFNDPRPSSSMPSNSGGSVRLGLAEPDLDSSLPEKHRTTNPEESTPVVDGPAQSIRQHTSGINPLKRLLGSSSRRNFLKRPSASIEPSKSSQAQNTRPRITLNPNFRPGKQVTPSIDSSKDKKKAGSDVPDLNELTSSINTDSDVELVYKTLYTTYTYFTTFFRASTTRVKSRAEVISNVITLTNILSPNDLSSLRSSCQIDKTCQFASSSVAAEEAFTKGFIGRPDTKPSEQVRSNGNRFISSGKENENELENGVLRTYYTTYTYFTTLQVGGTTSISSRTEVYSDIKSSGVPVSQLPKNSIIRPSASRNVPEIKPTEAPQIERIAPNKNRLKYSSISRDTTTTQPIETTFDEEKTTTTEIEEDEETTTGPYVVLGVTSETTETTEETTDRIEPTTTSIEDDSSSNEETPALTETAIDGEEALIDPTSPTPALKTFYTTYTYFTTLFRNGTSLITSNLETVTNTADATVIPSVVQPSVTFFTTFTYWTTSIDGDKTIITSQEETKTDILPASLTEQISLLPTSLASIEFTNTAKENNEIVPTSTKVFDNRIFATIAPELESGEIDATSVVSEDQSSASSTPTLASSSIISIEDFDTEFVLSTSDKPSSGSTLSIAQQSSIQGSSRNAQSRLTFTKPSRTFTPVIRPNIFNPTRRRTNTRRRSSTLTTVAIITRSDITPTLIATPVSAAPSSPIFGSSSSSVSASAGRSGSRFSSSRGSINPSRSSSIRVSDINPTSTESSEFQPSIVTNLKIRRPSPFRARLKERQKLRLKQLRNGKRQEKTTEKPAGLSITPPRFPAGLPGRTPIFVSSKTEKFNRRPKEVESKDANNEVVDSDKTDGNIRVPSNIQNLRDRARARINKLFRRRRPNFNRPRPGEDNDPLVVQESRRRKRQFRVKQQPKTQIYRN